MRQLVLSYQLAHIEQGELSLLRVEDDPLPVGGRQAAQQVHCAPPHATKRFDELRYRLRWVGFVGRVDGRTDRQLPLSVEVGPTKERVHDRSSVREVTDHLLQRRKGGCVAIGEAWFVESGHQIAHPLGHHPHQDDDVLAAKTFRCCHEGKSSASVCPTKDASWDPGYGRAYTPEVAIQIACDRCQAPLVEDAAYCEKCGERTRKARRLVRVAIRVELLFIALVILLVVGFTIIYYVQRP
jgi:predicted nucleic acid-binding Zn ribbon protein